MQISLNSNTLSPLSSSSESNILYMTLDSNIVNKNNFQFLYVIGKGGFGRVWKVQHKKTKTIYALKEMSKLKIIDKKSEKSINSEREFLTKLHHSFIVNMHYAFQDNDNLYLVMDMLSGGDLRYHISRYRRFSEEQTRFFIACLVLSLNYIHSNNVIHRDIKPENLVLDSRGYVRITDFGIAKENTNDNSSETSGTPGYMSPEVMRGKNHGFPVDFFAIGVIGYEFMIGKRPYQGRSRKEIKEQMLAKQAKITPEKIVSGWSNESVDFINGLLQRKEEHRLGYRNGAKELMAHPWLKYYPWKQLEAKALQAPFIPERRDNFDRRYCESVEKITENTKLRYEEILMKNKYRTVFANFYFYEKTIVKSRPLTRSLSSKEIPISNESTIIEKRLLLKKENSFNQLKKDNSKHIRSSSMMIKKDENTNQNNEMNKMAYNTSNKISKLNSARMRMKMGKNAASTNHLINNNNLYGAKVNTPYKKLNRVNSASRIVCKPSTEYLFNKIKSISIVNSGSRLNFFNKVN